MPDQPQPHFKDIVAAARALKHAHHKVTAGISDHAERETQRREEARKKREVKFKLMQGVPRDGT